MIKRDPAVAALLERMVPATKEVRAWDRVRADAAIGNGSADVFDFALPAHQNVQRRFSLRSHRVGRMTASLAFAIVILAVTAALALAGIGPFGSFRSWLTGSPGKPAPDAAKRAVLQSPYGWDAFPASTNLRELVRTLVGGDSYTLYGFRSGDALCLSVQSSFHGAGIPPRCTPATTLHNARRPIVFVVPDWRLGGAGLLSPEVSFGFVADGVRRVLVSATDGDHNAELASNVYLWVEPKPNLGNRVIAATAEGPRGRVRVAVPTAIYGFGGNTGAQPKGPARVEAVIPHPTIGWLDREDAVGIAPNALPIRPMMRSLIKQSGFTRFVKPDPLSDVTVGVSKKRLFLAGGLWGGSNPPYFAKGPLHAFYPPQFESAQSVRFSGVVADGVRAVRMFTANGAQTVASLRDNVFTVLVAASPPYRLVAYNAKHQVVASEVFDRKPLPGGSAVPAKAHALSPLLTTRGPHGGVAHLLVGRDVGGASCFGSACSVRCWAVRFSNGANQNGCDRTVARQKARSGPASVSFYALQQVGSDMFILGRASANVRRVALRFEGGDEIFARPVKGFVLFAVPAAHLTRRVQLAWLTGYLANGRRTRRFQPIYFHLRPRAK